MKGVIAFLLAIVIVQSALQSYQIVQAQHRRREVCVAVANLDAVISQTLRRSRKNLDTLAYYKTHLKEKAEQKREIDKTLALFAPRPCK